MMNQEVADGDKVSETEVNGNLAPDTFRRADAEAVPIASVARSPYVGVSFDAAADQSPRPAGDRNVGKSRLFNSPRQWRSDEQCCRDAAES